MQPTDHTVRDYLAGLRDGAAPRRRPDGFEAGGVVLSFGTARRLRASGILDEAGAPTEATRRWLDAAMEGPAPERRDGLLTRLGTGPDAFLAPHQVMAGQRFERLCERGRLRSRVTMAYAPVQPGGNKGEGRVALDDFAIDARRRLRELLDGLPSDCANVLIDVCGFQRGLEDIERERRWPRRSAKLVLRIGLEQVARQLGLDATAEGPERGRAAHWGERPTEIG